MDKVIVDQAAGQGIVPYLPLSELGASRPASANANAGGRQ
jgi:hypothetical protein